MVFRRSEGRHQPCCGGACLVAGTGNSNMLPVSLGLIVGPSALWFWQQPMRSTAAGLATNIGGVLLLLLSLLNLFVCYFTEPGLLKTVDEPGETPGDRPRKLVVIPGAGHGPRNLIDFRAKFCRETGNVVEVFDHFCPWTGNAVGRRNYRYYFGFLVFTTLLSLLVGITSLIGALSNIPGQGEQPVNYMLWLLVLFTCVILLLVGGLLGYHIPLVSSNRTTNESIKQVYANKVNPHDKGCCQNWTNFLGLMFQRPRPSYFDEHQFSGQDNGSLGDSESDRASLLFDKHQNLGV